MSNNTQITVAHGDGIGPEIMAETLKILEAAGARLDIETIEIGEKVYLRGHSSGIEEASWDSLHKTKVFLKAPITTPSGGGFKSLNVTVRKTLGLFANVRPCVAYHPFVKTNFPGMDLVIVRENEEDLYAGIEYRHTPDVYECLKILTRPGSERIARYAFEYARANGRKKVTCMIKDNIMKMTDGMFYAVFEEVGAYYPEIARDRMIIDIGAARIATHPNDFDVILAPNLYGDIISDIAADVTGSVGLGGSSNIGLGGAMFEAIHGSAPDIAGKGIANPSGLLLGAVMMLVHIGQGDVAMKIHNAWLKTLEDGIHTGDIYREGQSKQRVGTTGFGDAVIDRLGQMPSTMKAITYPTGENTAIKIPELSPQKPVKQEMAGIDIFVQSYETPDILAEKILKLNLPLELQAITNRGATVWPHGDPATYCVDHYRLRFKRDKEGGKTITLTDSMAVQYKIAEAGFLIAKTENLFLFDGKRGYTVGQGQ
ncbi:MAG: icd [Alphaproteobacteria bacterium]|nr:icd [Alphaproteobacteria bacterium]